MKILLEQEKKNVKWKINTIVDYISQFKTMQEFVNSEKFVAIQSFIRKHFKDHPDYNWKNITRNLEKKVPGKIEDEELTKELKQKYPQWNFDNVSYRNGPRNIRYYLDGLYCDIKDEFGNEHGISDNLSIKDLKNRGNGCRKCGKEKKISKLKTDTQEWLNTFPKEFGYDFKNAEFFYNDNLKQTALFVKDVICTNHDTPFLFAKNGVSAYNLRNDRTGCPICNDRFSLGEKKVIKVLTDLGYNPTDQKTFKDCFGDKGIRSCDRLKFDAYFENDGKKYCVEYDGIQHFKAIPYYGGEEGLYELKKRDRLKDEYCKRNGIKMIRIPYTEFNNIEKILKNELGHKNDVEVDNPVLESKKINFIISESQYKYIVEILR
jgi:hypothetical protein